MRSYQSSEIVNSYGKTTQENYCWWLKSHKLSPEIYGKPLTNSQRGNGLRFEEVQGSHKNPFQNYHLVILFLSNFKPPSTKIYPLLAYPLLAYLIVSSRSVKLFFKLNLSHPSTFQGVSTKQQLKPPARFSISVKHLVRNGFICMFHIDLNHISKIFNLLALLFLHKQTTKVSSQRMYRCLILIKSNS